MYTKCIPHVDKLLHAFCIHARYILYYKIYTKFCRNVVYILHTNILYTFCIQKFVEMRDTFCIQTFCIHFVYKVYTKVCRNVGYIFIQAFCIHFVYTNYGIQKVYIINISYTICMPNSYIMYI